MGTTDGRAFSRRLAQFLLGLTERDIVDIAKGTASLQVARREESRSMKRRRHPAIPAEVELRQVLEHLNAAPSREAGFAKVDDAISGKAGLEALARLADLPVKRRDTVDDLRERIVEATIGYRLSSNAVQGKRVEDG